jgi:hypothetical protein
MITRNLESRKWPTVGDLLDYISEQNVPRDAVILVENLSQYYVDRWDRIETNDDPPYDDATVLMPIHNGFGRCNGHFVLWQHF